MDEKKFLDLLKKVEKKEIVELEKGFKLVTKNWLLQNIKPAQVDEEKLEYELEKYSWNIIDCSYLVQYLLNNSGLKVPNFYLLDKDNFLFCDSSNIDLPYAIKENTDIKCYVLTFYENDIMNIFNVGYMSQKDAEKLFDDYASKYEDVSIYTLKDDTSIDADNIDDSAWSKIS